MEDKLGIPHRVLNVVRAKPLLNGAHVTPLVGELEAAGMRQHVRIAGKGMTFPRPWRKVTMKRIPVAALLLVALAAASLAVALPLWAAFSKPGTDPEPDADEATR